MGNDEAIGQVRIPLVGIDVSPKSSEGNNAVPPKKQSFTVDLDTTINQKAAKGAWKAKAEGHDLPKLRASVAIQRL